MRVLGLQVSALAGLQGEVGALERVVLAGPVLVDPGRAEADVVADPVLAAEAHGHVVRIEAGRHPLVVHQQALFEAVQRRIAGQGRAVVAGDLRQRAGQQQAALQFVDLVVGPALQHHPVLGTAAAAVADLQGHHVRTRQQVGMPQVVQAATSADEFIVARRGFGLRTEHAQFAAGIAPAVAGVRAPVERRAIQRALVLAELGPGQAGGVVAPQRLVLVPVHAQVEPAHRVHVATGVGIVAVDRVVQVRIEPAEDVLRVGLAETVEQPVQVALGGIGLRGHQVAAAQLGLAVERQAAVADDIVPVVGVAAERLVGTADLVLGDGHVGQRDAEEVATGDVHVQGVGRTALAAHADVEAVRADRHQVLGDELALQVHRIAFAVDAQRHARGDVAALDADARTVQRDVLLAQAATREDIVDQALGLRLLGAQGIAQPLLGAVAQRIGAALGIFRRHQLQHARRGLVELAVGAGGTQHVDQLIALAEAVLARQRAVPLAMADRRHVQRHARQRLDQVGIAGAVQAHLHAFDEGRIVATRIELHRLEHALAVEGHHRRRRYRQLR